MNTRFGIQQLQLGSRCTSERSLSVDLLSLSEAGFEAIALNGFMIRKTPFIARALLSLSGMSIKRSQKLPWREMLEQSKLQVLSIHEDLDTLENHFDLVEEEILAYSPKYIVVTGMYRFGYDDEEELGKLIVRLNRVGRELKELGVMLLYHNHSAEFQNVEGSVKAYEILINGLNPEWVNFEFDSYWANEAGADPLYYMELLGKRMKLYHICDRGNRNKGPYLTPIIKTDAVELGLGSMNLPRYAKKALELEVDAIILEQHRNYFASNAIASAKISAKYYREALMKQ